MTTIIENPPRDIVFFKSEPMAHQLDAMRQAWNKREFALFHEMGCGKTFTTINLAITRFKFGQINSMVVICPTPIKAVWRDEIDRWSTVPAWVTIIESGKKYDIPQRNAPWSEQRDDPKIDVLVVGIEALSQGHAFGYVWAWMKAQKNCLLVVDESSKVKNPRAVRSKRVASLGGLADYRMILTGTSITQGIHDLYSQFAVLNSGIIGTRNFTLFRNKYCVMGGFEGKSIIGYQNTDDLMRRVAPYVHIVKKAEALDLPPKVYEKITVPVTPEQDRLIRELKTFHEADLSGNLLTADTVLERLTRFQQIIGGNFAYKTADGKYVTTPLESVPKIDAMMGLLDDVAPDTSVIIWARFRPEIARIVAALKKEYGDDAVVEFHGGVSDEDRDHAKAKFQAKQARFFVSNQATGGMGLTLTAATLVIYFSNTFSMEDRLQSEDRCHRKGQDNKVTYVDIEAKHRYDQMILEAVLRKKDMRDFVDEQMEVFKVLMR